jgi:hypothetical protein
MMDVIMEVVNCTAPAAHSSSSSSESQQLMSSPMTDDIINE